MKEFTSITTTESVEFGIVYVGAMIAGVASIWALTVLLVEFIK